MLTPFGVAARTFRLEKGLRLLDVAEALGVTASYLSAVETGRKPLPDGFADQVARIMGLDAAETEKLKVSEDRTKKEVRLDKMPESQRALVAAFARRVDDLPADLAADLKKFLSFKSQDGEVPFHRKRRGLLVPPMSNKGIRELAGEVRRVFVTDEDLAFPVMGVLEFGIPKLLDSFYLHVADRDELGDDEGRVVANENAIYLRRDVYEAAWANDGRARFTACHELAHYMMHRQVTFARQREDSHPIYQDSEWQADSFAGALLLPEHHAKRVRSVSQAASDFGMTMHAVKVMLGKYAKGGS